MEYVASFAILLEVFLLVSIVIASFLFLHRILIDTKKKDEEDSAWCRNLLFAGGLGNPVGKDDVIKEIWTYEDLCNIRNDLNANYKLMADIIVPYYFETIGSKEDPFMGSLDAREHCLFHEGDGIGNFFIWLK